MPIFPPVATEPETGALTREQLLPAAKVLCGELGLGGLEVTAFADGSLPVYAVGDELVLKLYPPVYRREMDVESAVLRAVADSGAGRGAGGGVRRLGLCGHGTAGGGDLEGGLASSVH